jgi:hypothetical protein
MTDKAILLPEPPYPRRENEPFKRSLAFVARDLIDST